VTGEKNDYETELEARALNGLKEPQKKIYLQMKEFDLPKVKKISVFWILNQKHM
jgi:hypothetical protein